MKTFKTLSLATAAMVGLVAVGGLLFAQSRGETAACSEKIICPITGKLICRDECPNVDPNRADCPGRIVCPLTGKLVCKDRCPLHKEGTDEANDNSDKLEPGDASAETPSTKVPSCCSKKG
jgi:hypothetical protein